ncbi:hypothetical protein L7F22_014379 [Adiantum nelumboides]|nr:hypothetical protein [Adiantum nelumboides]
MAAIYQSGHLGSLPHGLANRSKVSAPYQEQDIQESFLTLSTFAFCCYSRGSSALEAFSASNKIDDKNHVGLMIGHLSNNCRRHYPTYWYELQGLADGSCVSLLEVCVAVKFSKRSQVYHAEECSDIAICSSLAVLGHNEDANVSVKDHVFLVHARLSTQASFTSFTLVGKLPSCAFGFNTYGVGFTLNAVPLSPQEIVAGGIGRNFISRDLLEATCLQSACKRVQVKELALGHSYNIFDIGSRRIVNVETASKGRFSVKEIGAEPFFHVNMYKHLEVSQVEDQSSIHRHARAAELSKCTKDDFLSVLGDTEDRDYPIYMEGPPANTLYRFGGHGCQKAYYI